MTKRSGKAAPANVSRTKGWTLTVGQCKLTDREERDNIATILPPQPHLFLLARTFEHAAAQEEDPELKTRRLAEAMALRKRALSGPESLQQSFLRRFEP